MTTPAQLAQRHAQQKQDAINREISALARRDRLATAWEAIYVTSPMPGHPEDYSKWVANVMSFVAVAETEGAADAFIKASPGTDEERKALSVIQAGLKGGAAAIESRIAALDATENDRTWKTVFNQNRLFWRVMQPDRTVPKPTADHDDDWITATEARELSKKYNCPISLGVISKAHLKTPQPFLTRPRPADRDGRHKREVYRPSFLNWIEKQIRHKEQDEQNRENKELPPLDELVSAAREVFAEKRTGRKPIA